MRLLLAPIVITPTKLLTPSHVKGLMWLDVLYKSTSRLADITYLWNLRPHNVTAQTLEYWEYLDRTLGPDADYDGWSDLELSAPYVRMHAEQAKAPFSELRPYLEAVERDGYVHPASQRLIGIWQEQFRRLNLHDPGLATNDPPGLGVEEVVAALAERGLCLDHRRYGGPVYLDATDRGVPLRRAVGADGQANYLICSLRQLLPLVGDYDRILLAYDRELDTDHVLLDHLLTAFGAKVTRLSLGRVPLDGSIHSSRHGGWESHTVDALADRALADFDQDAFWLGLRLYFIAVLTRESPASFSADVLRKQLQRAVRLIDNGGERVDDDAYRAFLETKLADGGYVDPYRLTVSLNERHKPVPKGNLLDEVFLP